MRACMQCNASTQMRSLLLILTSHWCTGTAGWAWCCSCRCVRAAVCASACRGWVCAQLCGNICLRGGSTLQQQCQGAPTARRSSSRGCAFAPPTTNAPPRPPALLPAADPHRCAGGPGAQECPRAAAGACQEHTGAPEPPAGARAPLA